MKAFQKSFISIILIGLYFISPIFLINSNYASAEEVACGTGFIYKGKVYDLHASFNKKGEGLRNIIKETPLAIAYLDRYQENHQKSLISAYTGTLGFLTMLVSVIVADQKEDAQKRKDVRTVGVGIGAIITLGGFFLSSKYLYENNQNLIMAVEEFNNTSKDKILLNAERVKITPGNIPQPEDN